MFTKEGKSPSKNVPEVTSNTESEYNNQKPLPPFPKLLGAEPIGIIYQGNQEKGLDQVTLCHDKKADSSTEQLLLTLIKETLSKLKAQSSLATSSRKALKIPKPFISCKYCGFNDHHSDECEYYPRCDIYGSITYELSGCLFVSFPVSIITEEPNSIDVVATFGVPLTIVGDLRKLINDIEAGKHDDLLSEMTNDDHMKTMDALCIICNSIQDNINADVTTGKVSDVDDSINLNVDESIIPSDPIVQSVDINTKSTSYAGAASASAKDQPKVNSNFRTLVADPVFDGVNISIPRKIVEKEQMGETWAERIMMNSKGFFFFKFDSRAGLEAVLEGGPWLIRKSPIILKKWSMDTRLLKEELTRILIWVKLYDVPIQIFEEDDISNSEAGLVDVVTIGIPSLYGNGFTKETTSLNGGSPDVIYTNNGFQTVGKKKMGKCKSKSTNGDQFAGPS
nr:hypothetical protein [Tanacetum cinerariifolium]